MKHVYLLCVFVTLCCSCSGCKGSKVLWAPVSMYYLFNIYRQTYLRCWLEFVLKAVVIIFLWIFSLCFQVNKWFCLIFLFISRTKVLRGYFLISQVQSKLYERMDNFLETFRMISVLCSLFKIVWRWACWSCK